MDGWMAERLKLKLTPHVVMTGSLKTLQHNWQQSFTDGCSAKTWGSCRKTQTLMWSRLHNRLVTVFHLDVFANKWVCSAAGFHTVSSSSSWRENVERRDMLDSEWSERTEIAESDLRGVPIGG